MLLLKRLAAGFAVILTVVMISFGTPDALESNATPLQSLYMIKQLMPKVNTVGLMLNKSDNNASNLIDQVKRASASLNVKIVIADVESLPDVAAQFRDLTASYHIQALWVIQNENLLSSSISRSFLIKNSTLNGIPLFAPNAEWVSAGACAAVVTDGQNTKLVVNQNTLNALGLKIPEKYVSLTQVLANK